MKKGIEDKVINIIDTKFEVVDTYSVPDIDDTRLTFDNTGLRFDATTLYIDMRDSTKILNKHHRTSVAKLHKAYFHVIVKIAKSLGGEVRSFNGDGMLVFFQGTTKNELSNAVKAAMHMKYMLAINEKVKNKLEKYSPINFGIGIDDNKVLCTKVGISGTNNRDLVWISNAVNKAVKIGDNLESPYQIGISSYVYNNLNDDVKYHKKKDSWGNDIQVDMWEKEYFTYNGQQESFYCTTYYWTIS